MSILGRGLGGCANVPVELLPPLLKSSWLNLIRCSYRVIAERLVHWALLELPGPQVLLALLAQLANKETEESL